MEFFFLADIILNPIDLTVVDILKCSEKLFPEKEKALKFRLPSTT